MKTFRGKHNSTVQWTKLTLIGVDLKVHVGEGNRRDKEMIGEYGIAERNVEGQMIVDFAKRMRMTVVNIYLKKEEHRATHKSEGKCT